MKKNYHAPLAELNLLRTEDVITASEIKIGTYVEGSSGFNFGASDFWE